MIMTRANYPNPQAYVLRWLVAKYYAENAPSALIYLFGWFPEPPHYASPKFLKALLMGDCQDIRRHLTQRMIIHERQLHTPEMCRRYAHVIMPLGE